MGLPDKCSPIVRLRVRITGAVQGVGFRPFVYRLARECGLPGRVNNSVEGVRVEVEGPRQALDSFRERLCAEAPPQAVVGTVSAEFLAPAGYAEFAIDESDEAGPRTAFVLPDLAVCADCLREIRDPGDRRWRYPFTSCTHCGPRFTITESLPYDRPRTTMRHFPMCAACEAEYRDPDNRRFHAQTNACPRCGPRLELWDLDGRVTASGHGAVEAAAEAVRAGRILALKGLGGFHLIADARRDLAVAELRRRKRRPEKPFAVMFANLRSLEACCAAGSEERALLTSGAAPLVLLPRRAEAALSAGLAPGNPYVAAMLPYTPLHALLLDDLGFPVVATSGNLTDEPICIDEREALERLGGVADLFLVHDRPILWPVDDSLVRMIAGRPAFLRRARGYAPLPVDAGEELPQILATGPHLKNTVALSQGRHIFVSQHLGDLETVPACEAFERMAGQFRRLYEARLEAVACDQHPDYRSTHYAAALAKSGGVPRLMVQHHYAHVLACLVEHRATPPVLGIAWDGAGFGDDGTVWGGEFLVVGEQGYERVGWLRPFRLPGGEQAIREPRRSALGALYEMDGAALFDAGGALRHAFSSTEWTVLRRLLERGVNAPWTSSAGRLFDAAASLLGLCQTSSYEGHGAMSVEFAAEGVALCAPLPFSVERGPRGWMIDWRAALRELCAGGDPAALAAAFHETLAAMMVAGAREAGLPTVVLSGGCFQNRRLTERAIARLRDAGFDVLWHRDLPPNDGAVAVGQVLAAARALGPRG